MAKAFISTILAAFLISTLSSCTTQRPTQAQYQANEIQNQYQIAENDINQCFKEITLQDFYYRLRESFVLDPDDPNRAKKLANNNYATDQNIADLFDLAFKRKPCQKKMLEDYGKIHPDYVNVLSKLFLDADQSIADAANRKITIGELNKKTLDNLNYFLSEHQRIYGQLSSKLQQSHAYEIQQRQQASQNLAKWLQVQQQIYNQQLLINSINRPIMTNCYYQGAFLNCTSY